MRIAAFIVIASLITTSPVAGQLRVETGGGQAHLDQMPASSLTALGGSFDALLGHARIEFAGNADDHIGLGVAGAMSAGLHYRLAPSGWTIEIGPATAVARGIGEQWAGTLGADLRVERTLGRVTASGSWQQGFARSGSRQSAWRRPGLGADASFGAFHLAASWQGTMIQDSVLGDQVFFAPIAEQLDTMYRARVRDIQDVAVRMAWASSVLSLSARVGRRFGATLVPQTWWEGNAALHLTPVMSLTMRTGHLASDVLLALRGGQYTTLGLQLDLLQRTHPAIRHPAFAPSEIVRESPTLVHLLFVLPPGTRRAVLAGDPTEWRPTELSRTDDGRWEAVIRATAGVYRINLRTDDGPWRVPPGLPATDDGFGSRVGLLVLDN